MWSWSTWETPHWHAELKPAFAEMKRAFGEIPESPPRR
jgi:hypothetical protein